MSLRAKPCKPNPWYDEWVRLKKMLNEAVELNQDLQEQREALLREIDGLRDQLNEQAALTVKRNERMRMMQTEMTLLREQLNGSCPV